MKYKNIAIKLIRDYFFIEKNRRHDRRHDRINDQDLNPLAALDE